ncbi:MAG: hypothetical protein AB7K41_14485 [Bdellovibrionales bacterium]
MNAFFKFLAGVLVLAIIAVLISKNAKTAQVIQSFASALSNILGAVVSPIGGSGSTSNGGVVVVPTPTPTTENKSPGDPAMSE